MAYRRRQQYGLSPLTTTKPTPASDEVVDDDVVVDSSSSNLAAKAIRASSAHRDSSLSSAYSSPISNNPTTTTSSSSPSPSTVKDAKPHQYTSMKKLNEPKHGFWGNLARKAKAILDDDDYDDVPQQHETPLQTKTTQHMPGTDTKDKYLNTDHAAEGRRKMDSPRLQKGLGAITSSIHYIGNAVEEGISIVENRTRKHIRKMPGSSGAQNQATKQPYMQAQVQPQMETDQEIQLKASRDVAMAMAAKAKLLLRELKTVKADLAFAKERCAQLEDENKILRESHERGDSPEDDDLIRLQLETLLAEKARLANENSVFARENRFLREVVEYHQLTMQDVIYLDEGSEEVTEVYPVKVVTNPQSPATPLSPLSSRSEGSRNTNLQVTRDVMPRPSPPPGVVEFS